MKCCICGNPVSKNSIKYLHNSCKHESYDHLFTELSIKLCDKCGLGFAYPAPDSSLLADFYQTTYKNNPNLERWIDSNSISQLLTGKLFVDFNENDVFVDVGAGVGLSFVTASFLLENPKLVAIELKQKAITICKKRFPGIKIYNSVKQAVISGFRNSAKIVLMSHSLEHFSWDQIIETLEGVKDLLNDEGVLIIDVPNDDFRTQKKDIRKNDTPHLYFFSLESILLLLKLTGFKVLYHGLFHKKISDACNFNHQHNEKSLNEKNNKISTLLGLKQMLRSLISRLMPLSLKAKFKKIWSYRLVDINKLRREEIFTLLKSPSFYSGSNRRVIRLVVKKGKTLKCQY